MPDNITLTGLVGSEPRSVTTTEGLAITSFRLASSQRRFDRGQDRWVDGETNWYTVTTFRQLAANAAVSIKKGERIVVSGRLKVRDWEAGGKRGVNVDVEADALVHDLSWGTAAFSRGAGASTGDRAGSSSTGDRSFPTEAQLEAIVDGQPSPNEDGKARDADGAGGSSSFGASDNAEIETPF